MNPFEYIKLFWQHEQNDDPVILLYEVDLDNERLARRSIDIFADGTCRNINDLYEDAIEITPIPSIEEFQSHIWGEELCACLIEKEEFEQIWRTHTPSAQIKKNGGTSHEERT